MNLSRCMIKKCKNCKYETRCFKEYKNKYSKNKEQKSKLKDRNYDLDITDLRK